MSLSGFSLWTLTLFLLSACEGAAVDDRRLTGAGVPVRAAPGQDVVLPCLLSSGLDLRDQTVEWRKMGVRADPSEPLAGVRFAFLYRDGRRVPEGMMASFIPRTSLSAGALNRGDASLTVRNVTLTDDGSYRCFIPQWDQLLVRLIVDPSLVKVSATDSSHSPTAQTEENRPKSPAGIFGRSRAAAWIPLSVFLLLLLLLSFVCVSLCIRRSGAKVRLQPLERVLGAGPVPAFLKHKPVPGFIREAAAPV